MEKSSSDMYQGGYSSLTPPSEEKEYITAGSLGLTTDPRVANQLKEASSKLSSGAKQIELSLVSPEIFDSLPQQQLKEIRRLSKLTGVDISVHGPVVGTSGISQQGFSELNREDSERRIIDTVKRVRELKPDGNIPVVFHSSEGTPGTEWKTLGDKRKSKRLIVINQESGQMMPLEEETKFYPDMERLKPGVDEKFEKGLISKEEIEKNRGKYYEKIPLKKGEVHTPEENLGIANRSQWTNQISQVLFNKERADEILQQNQVQIQHLLENLDELKNVSPDFLPPSTKQAYNHYMNAKEYLKDVDMQVSAFFNKAYKYGDETQKNILESLSKEYQKLLEKEGRTPWGQSQAMQYLISNLKSQELAPKILVPIEEFSIKQSSKTFGNAAFSAWKEYKDKAPIINIENPPVGHVLSTAEDLKKLVEESRNQFITKAKEEGLSEGDARKQAEKLIGATWDVGHINMLRKQGFAEKDIVEQSKIIAPVVKHVHLSDNFGFEHTELPMGMGNVPMKEIMDSLGKKGFEATKIVEAAQWWQHFQTPPLKETMEGIGSPIYSEGVGPFWNQSDYFQQGYSSGYGMMIPDTNYQMFGAGFAQLPSELGGQRPGAGGSRMAGTPME